MQAGLGDIAFAVMKPGVLWLIFVVAVAIFVGLTWVFFFHWRTYLMGRTKVLSIETAYLTVCMGLIASAFVSLLAH